jgi:hypothetical protein
MQLEDAAFLVPLHTNGCPKFTFVIPAESGIRLFQGILDPGFRRGDGSFVGHFILWSRTYRENAHLTPVGVGIGVAIEDRARNLPS